LPLKARAARLPDLRAMTQFFVKVETSTLPLDGRAGRVCQRTPKDDGTIVC
jgi:hypothetical protein